MENLIEMERRKRTMKENEGKSKFLGKAKQIGKGFGYFIGGAAKGFGGLVKEGGKFIGKEIKAEVDTELKIRRAYIEARREGKLRLASNKARERYGLKPLGTKTNKVKKKNKKRRIVIYR